MSMISAIEAEPVPKMILGCMKKVSTALAGEAFLRKQVVRHAQRSLYENLTKPYKYLTNAPHELTEKIC